MQDKELIKRMLSLGNSLSRIIVGYQGITRNYQVTLSLILPHMIEGETKEQLIALQKAQIKAFLQLTVEAKPIFEALAEIEALQTDRIIH